jgi:hypothetical protein
VVHEDSDGFQWEGLQAEATGQQIWVFVGPGLTVGRVRGQRHPQGPVAPRAESMEGGPSGPGARELAGFTPEPLGGGLVLRGQVPQSLGLQGLCVWLGLHIDDEVRHLHLAVWSGGGGHRVYSTGNAAGLAAGRESPQVGPEGQAG